MNYLFVRSHPYDGSWNVAAIKAMEEECKRKGYEVRETDLIADGFDPVMRVEDIDAWRRHTYADPMVKGYQEDVAWADVLVFVFPIWWGTMPAILKGYIDKVFLNEFAFVPSADGSMNGLLTDKKAIVVCTMQYPYEAWKKDGRFRDPVDSLVINLLCGDCGIECIGYKTFHQMSTTVKEHSGREITAKYIEECVQMIP